MLKEQIFNEKLEEATEIRTHIQDDLRKRYNSLKLMYAAFTGKKGKVLKNVVDMYHYRYGGYPNDTSLPKHQELIENFAEMVLHFDFIGFSKIYKDELKKYGITLTVNPDNAIKNVPVVEDALEVLQETGLLAGVKNPMFKEAVKAFVLTCDEIQGEICGQSNIIKKELAVQVKEECEIEKGDFTGSVMVNYHKQTGKITERKVDNLIHKLESKVTTGNFNIKLAEEEFESKKKLKK